MKNYIRLHELINANFIDPQIVFYSISVKYSACGMCVAARYSGYGHGKDFNNFLLSKGSAKIETAVITSTEDHPISLCIEAIGEVKEL